jgi:hypothetical protein
MLMLCRLLARVARVRITLTYSVILIGVTTALVALGPSVQDSVIRHASTNLHNLSHGHFGTLLGSAFVIETGPIYIWLPGLVCLLGLAELLWRSARLLVAFTVGHIGATLLVALGLAAAVELNWMPISVSWETDVGMSYGAAGVLGALTAAIPARWRPAWIGWWLAVGVAVVSVNHDFTDVGHVVAIGLGMLVSVRFGRAATWTPLHIALLVVAASFGYLILANTGLTLIAATSSGLAGCVVGEVVARRRAPRRSLVEAVPLAKEPVLQT